MNTGTVQATPIAYMYAFPTGMNNIFSLTRRFDLVGWVETPLYSHPPVGREGLPETAKGSVLLRYCDHGDWKHFVHPHDAPCPYLPAAPAADGGEK